MVDKGPRPVYAASAPTAWRTALLKEWDGAAWVAKPNKVWNGLAWVTKPVKFYSSTLINTRTPNTAVGAAIVGQTLFAIDMGDWTSTPDSFVIDWYDDNGAITEAANQDFYTIGDTRAGQHIYYLVTATLGAQTATALSAGTVTVLDIDLSTDTPVLTRTSASGTTPYTVDTALGAYTFAGYTIHRQLASDVGFGTILYDGQLVLTEAMLQAPLNLDWSQAVPPYTEPVHATYPQYYERDRVEAETPLGTLKTSAWSATISKTDGVAPVVLNVSDMTSGITLSNGALTGTGGGVSIDGVRATRGISSGKGYWEVNIDNKAGGTLSIGAADSTQSETAWWGNSGSDLHGFGVFGGGSINGWPSYPSGPTTATADRLDFAVDGTARLMWVRKASTWYPSGDPAAGTGGMSISGITGDILPGHQAQSNTLNACTYHFATASFVGTPPTGFSAI